LAAKNHPELENLILFYPALCIPDDARAGKHDEEAMSILRKEMSRGAL
jgi:hypothetical protein